MFKRRKPLSLLETTRELFWPSMGWKRALVYTKNRLIRLSDTTHSIALGLSIGMGVSFTPLLGTHFIQAGILAWLFRGNVFSAMMGTFVGNPWTFPFFWWGGFSLGRYFFEILGIEGAGALPDTLTVSLALEMMTTEPMTLFMPWMLGGYILVVATIPFSYPVYYTLIKAAKAARAKTIAHKQKQQAS
ncbi:MAG: hypothetical protein COB14_03725 [Alphaproteobacteria bacterium]|nr:MAG: hypothetical protein COB14_03725 [Alphaproteobacteria bacterium]